MKANELMIGDWVHVEAHRGFNAQNVKVETIPDNDGGYKYGHHYGKSAKHFFELGLKVAQKGE